MSEPPTASQTIGPFFHILLPLGSSALVEEDDPDALTIHGQVFDGDGKPVGDALIEAWQAGRSGRYAHPEDTRELPHDAAFTGFGRYMTDGEGRYQFRTVKPGRVTLEDGSEQAPHINLSIFARGLLHRLVTRIYFPDESEANTADRVLNRVGDPAARETLIARPDGERSLRFDIRLQGEGETVFFAV